MFGIYFHIPFCRLRCPFCDFAVTTQDPQRIKTQYIKQVCNEITSGAPHWSNQTRIDTIFIGGGTPSLLDAEDFLQILDTLTNHFELSMDLEWSIECNPEDVSLEKIQSFQAIGINRFSLGVQSFHPHELKTLGRKHNAREAYAALEVLKACKAHFSLDLMFGLVDQTLDSWNESLLTALSYSPDHISTYELTLEPKTAYQKWVQEKKIVLPEEDQTAMMFSTAKKTLEEHTYQTYEISNACLPGFQAKHNLSCWKGDPYWGLGVSAHSRWIHNNQYARIQNPKSLKQYMALTRNDWQEKTLWHDLDQKIYIEECILTGLRLDTGILIEDMDQYRKVLSANVGKQIEYALEKGLLEQSQYHLYVPGQNRIFTDQIAMDILSA